MTTDLTTVQDHPAKVLLTERAKKEGFLSPMTLGEQQALVTAADVLRGYERANGVTFAALDNDALEAVRKAYISADDDALATAVRDLLGLGD